MIVRREFSAYTEYDRLTPPGEAHSRVTALVDSLLARLKEQGLRVDSTIDIESISDSTLLMRNEFRIVATVEAEGLLPEERLPQGWRAIFRAP